MTNKLNLRQCIVYINLETLSFGAITKEKSNDLSSLAASCTANKTNEIQLTTGLDY